MSTGNFPSDIASKIGDNSQMVAITRENLLEKIHNALESRELSVSALERNAGVPKDTLRDFMRGKTQILRADKLQKIIDYLNPDTLIPISGYVGSDAEIIFTPPNAQDRVECPNGFEAGDIKALRIAGNAMEPVFFEGWIIYYTEKPMVLTPQPGTQVPYNLPDPNNPFAEYLNKPCIIRLKNGKTVLRTLKKGKNHFNLIAYNSEDLLDMEIADVAKIVFIKTV